MTRPETKSLTRTAGMVVILAALAAGTAGATNCDIGYPFDSSEPRTSVVFNESEVLRAFSPEGTVTASPGLTIKVWYNDEHAMVLGVRRVRVKTRAGTTVTDYPVAPLAASPDAATDPAVGTTLLDGDQAGTDTEACTGFPDLCDRPMFPALFVTDITGDPASRAGDWQSGGTPIPPHAVFGTWKAAVRTVDRTKSPAVVTVMPDADPAKNDWTLGAGDPPPSGLRNEGYSAEVRWNVDDLVAAGHMVLGHTYRFQFMVHDGDQRKTGGDTGESCVNVTLPQCNVAADCHDGNVCTDDICTADGSCRHQARPGCIPCHTDADCNDGDACTRDQCGSDGSCEISPIPGCPAEICDDGIDNDGDGLVDCADPDCAGSPACKPHEICGNCIDDDGNGLTDFEDPACCLASETFAMTMKGGRLRPRGTATRLRLRTVLAHSGLAVNPLEDDVLLQIRPEGGTDVFCARIPAHKFMGRHRGVFKFWDHAHSVPTAGHLDDMRIKVARDGSVQLRTLGKRAQMTSPGPGHLQVTVGFLNPAAGDGANRCSTTVQAFRAGRKGLLRTP